MPQGLFQGQTINKMIKLINEFIVLIFAKNINGLVINLFYSIITGKHVILKISKLNENIVLWGPMTGFTFYILQIYRWNPFSGFHFYFVFSLSEY
jgi:hypothetical protein